MFLKGDYKTLLYKLEESQNLLKLKTVLKDEIGLSTRLINRSKRESKILVSGKKARLDRIVKKGEIIEISLDEKSEMTSYDKNIDIIYEDCDLLIVNKKSNMIVHPTKSHQDKTLVQAIRHYSLTKSEDYKAHIINRLDMNTTGAMIIGKNSFAHAKLMEQMKEGILKKTYIAVCSGKINPQKSSIELFISRDDSEAIKMKASENFGKKAISKYRTIDQNEKYSLLELELITGRTHQLRVHLSHIGHAILGDELYQNSKEDAKIYHRQALHSYSVEFISPREKTLRKVNAEIDQSFRELLKKCSLDFK